jgi:ubiquitin-activating enzyme E1
MFSEVWGLDSSKSIVAGAAASAINPGLHVNALQNQVSSDMEEMYKDSFWEGLDVVVNNIMLFLYGDQGLVYCTIRVYNCHRFYRH